jgi:hypothetical protein
MSAPTAWTEGVREVHREAAGVMQILFFDPEAGARLVLGAALGDAWAAGMLVAIADYAQHIAQAPRHKPMLCLTCPTPIRSARGLTFAMTVPAIDGPRHALGSAVCPACAARADLESRALAALRGIWPDIRAIEPVVGPGTVQ